MFIVCVACIGIFGGFTLAALLFGVLPKHPRLTLPRMLLLAACVALVLASAFAWAYTATVFRVDSAGREGTVSFFLWFVPEFAVSAVGFVKETKRQKALRG